MVGSMDPIGNHCVCTLTVALERTGYGRPTFVCVYIFCLEHVKAKKITVKLLKIKG